MISMTKGHNRIGVLVIQNQGYIFDFYKSMSFL